MSNTQVGNVYQQIIADVVESSRVDFEEGGVDDNVLEELRLVWQSFPLSLSSSHPALLDLSLIHHYHHHIYLLLRIMLYCVAPSY